MPWALMPREPMPPRGRYVGPAAACAGSALLLTSIHPRTYDASGLMDICLTRQAGTRRRRAAILLDRSMPRGMRDAWGPRRAGPRAGPLQRREAVVHPTIPTRAYIVEFR